MRFPFPIPLPRRTTKSPVEVVPTSGHGDPQPQPSPSVLRIPEAALGDIRALEVLIDQHARTARALERELTAIVANSCNVNLQTEHWELDSRHGLIERRD